MIKTVIEIDAKNLLCPMPVIKVQNKARELESGDEIIITCTDPGAKHDIPAWCRVHGHKITKIEDKAGRSAFTITILIS